MDTTNQLQQTEDEVPDETDEYEETDKYGTYVHNNVVMRYDAACLLLKKNSQHNS